MTRAILWWTCWIVRKLGHPWGGEYASGTFVCLECGAVVKDTAWHLAQTHNYKECR